MCTDFIADMLDVISAILARFVNEENKIEIDIWRYITNYVLLFFGFFLNLIEAYFSDYSPFEELLLDEPIQFVYLFGLYIIVTISLSIVRNIGRCGVTLPAFLSKLLISAKESIDKCDSG